MQRHSSPRMESEQEGVYTYLLQRIRQARQRYESLTQAYTNVMASGNNDPSVLSSLCADLRELMFEYQTIQEGARLHDLAAVFAAAAERRAAVSGLHDKFVLAHAILVAQMDPHITKGTVISLEGCDFPVAPDQRLSSSSSPYGRNSFVARLNPETGATELVATCERICGHCGKAIQPRQKSVCGGCRHTRYCSKACQIAHRPMHKGVCREMQAAREKA